MTNEEKAQEFLKEYNELTKKHGFALQPIIKPDFQLIVLDQSNESDSKPSKDTQPDTAAQ